MSTWNCSKDIGSRPLSAALSRLRSVLSQLIFILDLVGIVLRQPAVIKSIVPQSKKQVEKFNTGELFHLILRASTLRSS